MQKGSQNKAVHNRIGSQLVMSSDQFESFTSSKEPQDDAAVDQMGITFGGSGGFGHDPKQSIYSGLQTIYETE